MDQSKRSCHISRKIDSTVRIPPKQIMDKVGFAVMFSYYMHRYIRMRRKRRLECLTLGSEGYFTAGFYKKHPELRDDPDRFASLFRMSRPSFEELLQKIEERLHSADTGGLSRAEMLSLTLIYLAEGSSEDLYIRYSINLALAKLIIQRVCCSINTLLKQECMAPPSDEKLREIVEGFEVNAKFPRCFGAMSSKSVRVKNAPLPAKDVWICALADSDRRLICYSTNFIHPQSFYDIFFNQIAWPEAPTALFRCVNYKSLSGDGGPPHAAAGNGSFPPVEVLLTPYREPPPRNFESAHYDGYLTEKIKVFNKRLASAQNFCEGAFALLSNRWKIFHRPLDGNMTFVNGIIDACCILHNYVHDREGYDFADTLLLCGFEDIHVEGIKQTPSGDHSLKIREELASYFISEKGSVSWQYWTGDSATNQ